MLCQCWCRRVRTVTVLHSKTDSPTTLGLIRWSAPWWVDEQPKCTTVTIHHHPTSSPWLRTTVPTILTPMNEKVSSPPSFSTVIQLVGVRGGDRVLAQVGGDADEPVNEGAHWRARLSPELANYSDYPPSDPAPQHYSTLCCTDAGVRASIRSGAKTT